MARSTVLKSGMLTLILRWIPVVLFVSIIAPTELICWRIALIASDRVSSMFIEYISIEHSLSKKVTYNNVKICFQTGLDMLECACFLKESE